MQNLYQFNQETPAELATLLARRLQQRRLEKGLSREALSMISGVPAPTIAKFEQKHAIALTSFLALAQALGYNSELKALLREPIFNTMEEMETIKRNANRKRGRNEFSK